MDRDFIIKGNVLLAYKGAAPELVIPEGIEVIMYAALAGYSQLHSLTLPPAIEELPEGSLCCCPNLRYLYAPGLSMDYLYEKKLMLPATVAYLCQPRRYTDPVEIREYERYSASHKKKLLEYLFKDDRAEGLATYAALGKITKKNFETAFLQPAMAAEALNCVSFLMEWKEEHLPDDDLFDDFALEADPFDIPSMRKQWKWTTARDGIRLRLYTGKETALLIPHRIGDKPVLRLEAYALSPRDLTKNSRQRNVCSRITALEISDSVEEIGAFAFAACGSLRTVEMGNTVKILQVSAFLDCKSLESVHFSPALTEIGAQAFRGCSKLGSIRLPPNLRLLGEAAFCNCSSLTAVQLPAGLKVIEQETFAGCSALQQLNIPEAVEEIIAAAFFGCKNLRILTLPQGLRSIGHSAFRGCNALEQLCLPDSLCFIHPNAFDTGSKITIHASEGSYAAQFAREHGLPLVII